MVPIGTVSIPPSHTVRLTVGFIVIPRCEMRESEMQCFLDREEVLFSMIGGCCLGGG